MLKRILILALAALLSGLAVAADKSTAKPAPAAPVPTAKPAAKPAAKASTAKKKKGKKKRSKGAGGGMK